jgi:hypothetical protein
VNTIKVDGTGDPETRIASLEQAVNYGEVILPFTVVGEAEGGGGTGGPPTGPAGGDLTGTYPNPTIGPGAVGNAEISDVAYSKVTGAPTIPTTLPPNGPAGGDLTGAYPNPTIGTAKVTRVKIAADAWLSPIPVDPANVGQTLTVDPGPVLAWKDPAVTQGLSGTWNWKATAAVADPGSGNLNPDNLGTPTILCFSTTTISGTDARNIFATTQVGDILLAQQKTDATKWAKFQVRAALVDHTTWFEVPVTVLANGPGGAIANNANVAVQFQRGTGTTGPTGPAGGDLTGSYPNPTIAKLNGATVGTTTPLARGDILVADGTPALKRLALGAASTVLQSNGTDAVWGTSLGGPPSGAASGSLAGSYPGPSIAASAVRGTPSTGGTAREIAKASIWGGEDLIDLSVPTAKLAALAVTDAKVNDVAATKLTGTIAQARLPVSPSGLLTANLNDAQVTTPKLAVKSTSPAQATAPFPVSFTWSTDSVESGAIVSQALTVRGGYVLCFVYPSLTVSSSATSWIVVLSLKRDGVTVGAQRYDFVGPANVYLPIGGFSAIDTGAAAGARTYTVTVVFYGAGTNVQTAANTTGALSLVELG